MGKVEVKVNFQFDIGKQRRNTLFRFMNTLIQFFCGEHPGSVSCRFCVLDLLLSNSFPQSSNEKKSFVKGKLPDWTFSSIKWERKYASSIWLWNRSQLDKHNSKENTLLPRGKSRCNAPPDWLKTMMARIAPSLQLAKTEFLTPYTFGSLSENFSAYSILCAALFSAASPAERRLACRQWSVLFQMDSNILFQKSR